MPTRWLARWQFGGERRVPELPVLGPCHRKMSPSLIRTLQLDIPWGEYKYFKGLHVELDNGPHYALGIKHYLYCNENPLQPAHQWASQRHGNTKHEDKDVKDQCFSSNNLQASQCVGKKLHITLHSRNFHLKPLLWVSCHSSTVWLCRRRLSP